MLRLGIVDFDSSHAVEFTRRFNHVGVSKDQFVDGARVVVGCPGESLMSPERIPLFLPQVQDCGVEIVEDPAGLLGKIDAALVLSVCGAAHLARVRMFLDAGIPVFVDKPFATSYVDAAEMIRRSQETCVLLWEASAMRYTEEVLGLQELLPRIGPVHGVLSYGPGWLAEGNPGLLHYGVHATQQLYAILGTGCRQVTNHASHGCDTVVGEWHDGRQGIVRATRAGHSGYGVTVFADRGVVNQNTSTQFGYRNLCQQIVTGFRTRVPPIPPLESLEVMQFLLAANLSRERGGQPVQLSDVVS